MSMIFYNSFLILGIYEHPLVDLGIWFQSDFAIYSTSKLLSPNFNYWFEGQLNSEWIYEDIVSPKIPTKNYRDFCPGSLLEGRAEIFIIFDWDFGKNDDFMDLFWI